MKKIKAVIIDDDLPSATLLADELRRRDDTELCGIASTLSEGERLVELHKPDLLFLDMEFPEGNGLAWYERAKLPEGTRVVFHTCYQRYIHDALSLRVFDFLLKPFAPSELDTVVSRWRKTQGTCALSGAPTNPVAPGLAQGGLRDRSRLLSITSVTNAKLIVNPDDVAYFRYMSDRKIWECVFCNLKRIILKRQTTAETILGYGTDFVRTHKQYIVNIRYVGIINANDLQLLPPLDDVSDIKISKSYRRDLLDRFYDI